jgi:hypothetical protein
MMSTAVAMGVGTVLVGIITFLIGRNSVTGPLAKVCESIAVQDNRIKNLEKMQSDVNVIKELLLRHVGSEDRFDGTDRRKG